MLIHICLFNIDRLPLRATETLGAILHCYGGALTALMSNGMLTIVLPEDLLHPFMATLSRDVLPVQFESYI
jgi:hypothetical protein